MPRHHHAYGPHPRNRAAAFAIGVVLAAALTLVAVSSNRHAPTARGAGAKAGGEHAFARTVADDGTVDDGTAGEPAGQDITDTAQGQRKLDQAEALTGLDMADYTVVTDVPGDTDTAMWVVPPDADVPDVTTTADGEISASVDQTPDAPSEDAASDSGVLDAVYKGGSFSATNVAATPGKAWQSAYCYARYDTKLAWFDHCYQWGYVTNDNDNSRDHWFLKQYGTCKSVKSVALKSCTLGTVKSSTSPALYWEDWGPKADSSAGNCRETSDSVSAFGLTVGGSFTACEKIDITKYADAAHFSVTWDHNGDWTIVNTERAVQMQIAMGVAQGKLPGLTLSWAVDAVVVPG